MIFHKFNDVGRREALPLPDGRRAGALRVFELMPEMLRLKIPGIKGDMGKAELLEKYEAHVLAHADPLQPANMRGKSMPSAHMLKAAVAQIARSTQHKEAR